MSANAWHSVARLGHDPNLPEVMYPSMVGGSSTTLTRDSCYIEKAGTSGSREWLAYGALDDDADAGLSCATGDGRLGSTGWDIGGRLSVTGNRGEWAA